MYELDYIDKRAMELHMMTASTERDRGCGRVAFDHRNGVKLSIGSYWLLDVIPMCRHIVKVPYVPEDMHGKHPLTSPCGHCSTNAIRGLRDLLSLVRDSLSLEVYLDVC